MFSPWTWLTRPRLKCVLFIAHHQRELINHTGWSGGSVWGVGGAPATASLPVFISDHLEGYVNENEPSWRFYCYFNLRFDCFPLFSLTEEVNTMGRNQIFLKAWTEYIHNTHSTGRTWRIRPSLNDFHFNFHPPRSLSLSLSPPVMTLPLLVIHSPSSP